MFLAPLAAQAGAAENLCWRHFGALNDFSAVRAFAGLMHAHADDAFVLRF